jgi:SNF2 family DNA or RNA helicase
MERTFIATLPDGDEVLAPIVLTQMLRLVQIASNPVLLGGSDDSNKWKAVGEMLEYEQLPAIVWTAFKKTAEMLEQRLGERYRVATLTGDTPEEQRQDIINRFQNGSLDILIAHPGVGKYGFTMTAARTAIYLERGYNGDDYYQSLHRIRRIGTTVSPHVIHLISARPNGVAGGATIDNVIDKVLTYKRDNSMKLTTGLIRDLFSR